MHPESPPVQSQNAHSHSTVSRDIELTTGDSQPQPQAFRMQPEGDATYIQDIEESEMLEDMPEAAATPPACNRTALPFSNLTVRTISQGAYPYTEDLLALTRIGSSAPRAQPALRDISEVKSPLVPARWKTALDGHPDARLVDYLPHDQHGKRAAMLL